MSDANRGMFDTLRLKLRARLAPRDRETLIDEGFEHTPRRYARKELKGRTYSHHETWMRDRDGCRVTYNPNAPFVAIEFEVGRVLRRRGDEQHLVAVADVVRLVAALPCQLLPLTTRRAGFEGIVWALVRADLAVDFHGPIQDVMKVLRLARTPRIRSEATYDVLRLIWKATRRMNGLVFDLYDKGRKIAVDGLDDAPPVGTYGRFEARFWTQRRLRLLVEAMGRCIDGEPGIPVEIKPGEPPVMCRLVDWSALHAFLRREVEVLDGGPVHLPPPKLMRPERAALVAKLAAYPPQFHWRVERSPDKQRRLFNDALLHARRATGLSLVELLWPRARDAS